MKSRKLCLSILTLAIVALPSPVAAQNEKLSDQEKSAIRTMLESEFTGLIIAGDWNGVADLFREDAVHMPTGEPAIHGRAAIKDFLDRNWGPLPVERVSQTADKIDGRGNIAYARGRYAITVNLDGTLKIHDEGKYLIILEKEAGGRWLLTNVMYSRDIEKPRVEG